MTDRFGWDNNFGNNPSPTRHVRAKAARAAADQRRYYDNSLVVGGLRVAATNHQVHGWGWFFEDSDRAPVKGWQTLKNVQTLEDEVRAVLPKGWLLARETAAAKRERANEIERTAAETAARLREEAADFEQHALSLCVGEA
jgi:hypothetical protein